METIDNLYFTDGLIVHVERAISGLFFACAFCKAIQGKYKIPLSVINDIETGGDYNTHYWGTIKAMIESIKRISKQKLIKKSYYN